MTRLSRFLNSTVGNKIIMAVTGLVLVGFVVGHMVGNLQLYLPAVDGVPPLDAYGAMLKSLGHGFAIWGARGFLLLCLALHVRAFVKLRALQAQARPSPYAVKKSLASTIASRTMQLTGPFILLFIVVHIAHITLGVMIPDFDAEMVHATVVKAFENPLAVVFYILAQLALAPHLAHGGYSMFRSLGVEDPAKAAMLRKLAAGLAGLIVAANISFPLAVFFGIANSNPYVH